MYLSQCEACKYYSQHFVKFGRRFVACGCGHCNFPMIKQRYAKTPACQNFVEKKAKKSKTE